MKRRISSLELAKSLESLNWVLCLEDAATKLLDTGRIEEAEQVLSSCAEKCQELSAQMSKALRYEILVIPGAIAQRLACQKRES